VRVAFALFVSLLGIASVFAESANDELVFEQAYVRALPPTQTVTAAFMRLVNNSNAPIVIIGAQSTISEKAEIHAHSHRNGMMRMERVNRISVPAHGEFILASGGHHLMLIGLKKTLLEGDKVVIELQAEDGRVFRQEVAVRSVLNEE
jgi:copper(I)-binding protein